MNHSFDLHRFTVEYAIAGIALILMLAITIISSHYMPNRQTADPAEPKNQTTQVAMPFNQQ